MSRVVAKIFFLNVLFVVAVTGIVAAPRSCTAAELAVSRWASEGLSGWDSKSFKGMTDYRIVKEGDRTVVKAVSHAAASGLIRKIHFSPAKYRYLRWSWKIARSVSVKDERTKAGDDYAARLYVVFPGRFFWKTRAINYVWAHKLPKGEFLKNPYTANAMMMVVESGDGAAGQWLTEQRDLLADYRTLFGSDPPDAEAIAIMTDSDSSGGSAEAWYGEISLSTEGK